MKMKEVDKNLLESIGFSKNDFVVKESFFPEKDLIKERVEVFFYEAKGNSEFNFYLFSADQISDSDLNKIHNRVWNEYRTKLYFTRTKEKFSAYPALTNANDKFFLFEELLEKKSDSHLADKVNKAQIDTGYLWLKYFDIIKQKQKKFKTVHEELISALISLRKKLVLIFKRFKESETRRDFIIQALIDRTLFIKFLEDKHIINSYFYNYYFDRNCNFETFLTEKNTSNINQLFHLINTIFDNSLFKDPEIEEKYLNKEVLECILSTIQRKDKDGQLSLFNFEFDVIPVEFIGHIYQAFLSGKKSSEGIVYTPENLAKIINEKVIRNSKNGKVLDPSCGSGVFLVLALRQLIKNNNWKTKDVEEILQKRIELLSKSIFGIEKDPEAYRITYFSLYLELLNDIEPEKIKKLIIEKIEKLKNKKEEFKLFSINFSNNILCGNSLDTVNPKFENTKFDFIVGNPPWKAIREDDEEVPYWERKKEIAGFRQLSQLFMLKLEDWENTNTRFGFVLNSSNFFNEKSEKFRNHFFKKYKMEEYYDLSKVKDLVFENAKESASVIIFSNPYEEGNSFPFYQFQHNTFSKLMNTVFISKEDTNIVKQDELIGNSLLLIKEQDRKIINKLENLKYFSPLSEYLEILNRGLFNSRGIAIVSSEKVMNHFKIEKKNWNNKSDDEQKIIRKQYKNIFLKPKENKIYNIPFIDSKDLSAYEIISNSGYLSKLDREKKKDKFDRAREEILFIGEKIIYKRLGDTLDAIFSKEHIYFSDNLNTIKLKDKGKNYLILSILNSKLMNYFINTKYRKRQTDSHPKINENDINKIPIPKRIDPELLKEINSLSKKLCEGTLRYTEEVRRKIDDLIYELYDLNILEIDRIEDSYIDKNKLVDDENLKEYCKVFYQIFHGKINKDSKMLFEVYKPDNSLPLNLVGIKVTFIKKAGKQYYSEPIFDTLKKFISSILENSNNYNFLFLQNIFFGKECIYLIKENRLRNWSKSQAANDVNEIIRRVSE